MLKFLEDGHVYSSGDERQWLSVTSITKLFQEPFDRDQSAKKASKNKKSKWYKRDPEEIKKAWDEITEVSIELGNWYHKTQEKLLCEVNNIEREGLECKIIKPVVKEGVKYAPDQKLLEGSIYPEHFVYLDKIGICGQSDIVEVRHGRVYITDYKTSKEISVKGYKNWEGVVKKLLKPLSHLDDCKLNLYTLQLSLYMYIILKYNPNLKPGKLVINHILFKEIGRDKNDNPIYERDSNHEPEVMNVVPYEVPYMKTEVNLIIKHLESSRGSKAK